MQNAVNHSSGASRSCWMAGERRVEHQPLAKDIRVDVAIIGAGIAGLSAAYTLSKHEKTIAVIEDGLIGSGETSRTSAHLSSYIDGGFFQLSRLFGIDATALVANSHALAIDRIEQIALEEDIACDFKRVNGYLFSDGNRRFLEEEASILEKIKAPVYQWVDRAPCKNFDTGPCLRFLDQAQFHPIKYIQGLVAAIKRRGGHIYEATHAAHIKDGHPCLIKTSRGQLIKADDVIVATNSPINDRLILQSKQAQYRTYVIAISLPKGQLEEALYWDTDDPYHYIRTLNSTTDADLVLIGGEDHRTGKNVSPQEAFANLHTWAKKRFIGYDVIDQWSGQVIEPIDGIAFCGKNPGDQRIYVHTGTSGSGLTYGAIAGILLPDLILKQSSQWESIYDPSRKTIKAAGQFLKDACLMVAEYADWLKPKIAGAEKLLPTEGVVHRRGLSMEAIYKDANGEIHRLSAACPHLGGVVRWNSLEKTWDCPCHGSRFNTDGEVLNGPANRGLTKIK